MVSGHVDHIHNTKTSQDITKSRDISDDARDIEYLNCKHCIRIPAKHNGIRQFTIAREFLLRKLKFPQFQARVSGGGRIDFANADKLLELRWSHMSTTRTLPTAKSTISEMQRRRYRKRNTFTNLIITK